MRVDVEDLLERVAEIRLDALRLVGQCAGGRSVGAWYVRDAGGTDYVMKVAGPDAADWFNRVSALVRALTSRGYPAPEQFVYSLDVATAVLQPRLPGEVNPRLTADLTKDVIRLNRIQRNASPQPSALWVTEVQGIVRHSRYAAALETWSPDAATFVRRARNVIESIDWSELRTTDVVHYDFHPENIMSVDRLAVSGVIDWDGARAGDHLYDLVHFAYTAARLSDEHTLRALWTAVFAEDRGSRAAAYIAAAAISVTGWILLNGGPQAAMWALRSGEAAFAYLEAGRFTGLPS